MVQFLSINFFLGYLQFLLGFSIVPVFLCHPVHTVSILCEVETKYIYIISTTPWKVVTSHVAGLFSG